MLPIFGAGILKLMPLLATPLLEVTTRLPLVASAGTDVLMLLSLQFEIAAAVPLMVTVPEPAPKFVPVTVTVVPAVPDNGDTKVIAGTGRAVTVIASEEVLNLSVTLWRLLARLESKIIPTSWSVLAVVRGLLV